MVDAAPATTAADWIGTDTVAAAAEATAAAFRRLAAVVPSLPPVAVRTVATAVERLHDKRGVALAGVAVEASMASGLAYRGTVVRCGAAASEAVRCGAAASAAAVLSSGLDTALFVVAAWEVDGEVVAAAMGWKRGRGRAKRTSSALQRCTATAQSALNYACCLWRTLGVTRKFLYLGQHQKLYLK